MEHLSTCGVLVSFTNFSHYKNICNYPCLVTGCILAELYTGYPLFPGENEVEQLACIMELLGTPPDELISQATRRRLFFGKFINFSC